MGKMLSATLGHLLKSMFHSLYAMICLAKIETRTAVVLPAKSQRPAALTATKRKSRSQRQLKIAQRLPADTWDGHMHVIDPKRYPLDASAVYMPSVHSAWDAISFENSVSMKNVVAVQPSIYGNDNSAMLDAMKALGPDRSRGVVVFDEATIDDSTLQEWHSLGVRGVRLNLASTGKQPDIDLFKRTIERYAAIVKPLDWMVQIYMSMDLLPALEHTMKALGVKVCLDHFAQPVRPSESSTLPFDPYTINGFSSLVRLLQHGTTFVKFSAPYRVNVDDYQLDAMAKEILRIKNDRVVFATDWPHTRFEGLDIIPFEERCLEWAEEAGCVENVFSSNAKTLWNVRG